jgi:hypothetical protein
LTQVSARRPSGQARPGRTTPRQVLRPRRRRRTSCAAQRGPNQYSHPVAYCSGISTHRKTNAMAPTTAKTWRGTPMTGRLAAIARNQNATSPTRMPPERRNSAYVRGPGSRARVNGGARIADTNTAAKIRPPAVTSAFTTLPIANRHRRLQRRRWQAAPTKKGAASRPEKAVRASDEQPDRGTCRDRHHGASHRSRTDRPFATRSARYTGPPTRASLHIPSARRSWITLRLRSPVSHLPYPGSIPAGYGTIRRARRDQSA